MARQDARPPAQLFGKPARRLSYWESGYASQLGWCSSLPLEGPPSSATTWVGD